MVKRSLLLALAAAFAAVIAGPLPAGAEELASPPAVVDRVQASHPIECYCRAQGRVFWQGDTICLRTADGPRLAECRMEVNVMSWGVTDRRCPES
jgi:hypothetical protein